MNTQSNNQLKIVGFVIALVVESIRYYDTLILGFPDVNLTEYERFYRQTLYPLFMGINAEVI